jgi:hypothetical protein
MRTVTASFAFAFVLSLAAFAAASGEQTASAPAPQVLQVAQAPAAKAAVSDSFASQIPELDPKSGGLASLLAAGVVAVVTRRIRPSLQLKHG